MAALVAEPAPNTSYFTPAQSPPAGTAAPPKDGKPVPTLFQPIKIRGVEFHNRLFMSPMDMCSGNSNASVTPFHTAVLGPVLVRGPGLTFMDGTAVSPEGRVTVHDCGLWSEDQVPPLRALVEFAHSQGQKFGLQLAHSGRKGSVAPIWLAGHRVVPKELGGWPDEVVAPSPILYSDPEPARVPKSTGGASVPPPKQLTKEEIRVNVAKWGAAAQRAVQAGVDVVEIHAAHGYLLHEFLSPVTNKRTDEYGGSFDNRVRIVTEVVDAVRAAIPSHMPLFLRLSATDWLEHVLPDEPSWTLEDTVRLSGIVADRGVDLIDVSSGGLDPRQKIEFVAPAYQAHFAEAVKKAVGDRVLVSAVGGITTGKLAQEVLDKGQADIILVGKQFLKDPAAVTAFAEDLGIEVKLPHQIAAVQRSRECVAVEEVVPDLCPGQKCWLTSQVQHISQVLTFLLGRARMFGCLCWVALCRIEITPIMSNIR
ncbi:FMN-linked oxidoreductase [Trametes cingulata]|nr:FMN-linked oxidoreductase [Trametes cingulata]